MVSFLTNTNSVKEDPKYIHKLTVSWFRHQKTPICFVCTQYKGGDIIFSISQDPVKLTWSERDLALNVHKRESTTLSR